MKQHHNNKIFCFDNYLFIYLFNRTRKTWSHTEVDSEVEEGLVELEVPLENEEVVLSWEGGSNPRPLCAIANRARHGNKVKIEQFFHSLIHSFIKVTFT